MVHPNIYAWSNGEIFFSSYTATVFIQYPGHSLLNYVSYNYACNQTVLENGTLVRVDCKPDYVPDFMDTFYVPSRPEETTLECVTNYTSSYASLINLSI